MINLTFVLRRLHSLCGLLAVGGFLLEHIFTNARVIVGAESFNAAIEFFDSLPAFIMLPMEIFFVALPLLFHGLYGIHIALEGKTNTLNYPYVNNIQFTLQRFTAWYLVVFIIVHVIDLRFLVKGSGTPISYQLLDSMFTNPFVFLFYLIGMLAAIFHFCNGITTFAMTWGIAKGPNIQKTINVFSMLFCAFLSLVTVIFMGMYIIN